MILIALIIVVAVPVVLVIVLAMPSMTHQRRMMELEYRSRKLMVDEREAALLERMSTGRGLHEVMPRGREELPP